VRTFLIAMNRSRTTRGSLRRPSHASIADRGSRGIRDQPRNPPKYTEKRIRINFPFPCPFWGRAHARRVGSPARSVGSFHGYALVIIFLAWVIWHISGSVNQVP
jgi:hypothetical protein